MLPLKQELILNLIPGGAVKPAVRVSQNDADSRTVEALLYHGNQAVTTATGVTAQVACTAPDGQQYTIDATLTDGNPVKATFVLPDDVTAVAGFVDCELVLTDGDKTIGTGNFFIKVEGEPGAIPSAEYESIEAIKEATQHARDEVNAISGMLLNRVSQVEADLASTQTEVDQNATEIDALALQAEGYADALEVDPEGLVYLLHNGERIAGPYGPFAGGGGGGGGGGNNAVLTVANASGFVSKTIAEGDSCNLTITWSSIEDEMPTGNGTVKVNVNGITKYQAEVEQGTIVVDAGEYLVSGANVVKISLSDIYGNTKTVSFNITAVSISISSTFDATVPMAGAIVFPYTPVGSVSKTVYFKIDNVQVATITTSVSGRQLTQNLPSQPHGAHSLEVYFECVINGQTVESNHLYYELICIEDGVTTPIIASPYNKSTVPQYDTLSIPYSVYTPNALESEVEIKVNGTTVSEVTVDRTQHVFTYRADGIGALTIVIKSGTATKTFQLTVTKTDIDVEAVTENLALYLSSAGRSNNEANPGTWEYGNISASLTGFDFSSDGWINDEEGITALKVKGDARVTIPYKPFAQDFRGTGKTIEIEFATHDVLDYDAQIISCYSGNRGFTITSQRARLKSEQSEISMQYKEDEHIRLAFVVTKRANNRLILLYINGVASGVVQYPENDDFSQTTPVNISIGSNDCTTDIYCIRVYDNDLTRSQVMDNWIADTQVGATMLARYRHNDVYDEYGNIVISKLPSDLPYMIIECAELPQYKGDKKTVSGSYVDPVSNSNSFTFTGCQANVQGTSSAPYARKNYDMQFKNGFEMVTSGHQDNFALAPTVIPFNRFVLKADVASSESANNVELVKLFCDATPFKRAEQIANNKVRQGIYGFPIVLFWRNTNTDEIQFMGKYNFNLPKRAPAPYGYSGNMESWEFQNNTSNLMLFKSDYFDETMVTDPTTGEAKEAWRYDYEARFPSDEWTNYAKLQELQSFVYSTYRANATGDTLDDPVTYDGVEYTTDSADYRLAKFRAEFGNYAEVTSFLFYYIFTELFLMVDSRAKNLFIGFSGEQATGTTVIDRKAVAEPYDMDTAIGTNNEGSLVFGYSLEDTDTVAGANVFNGQDSVLWNNVRDAFPAEIVQLYQTIRSQGIISFDTVMQRFTDHQSKWPEAVFNEDSWFKYIDPLIAPDQGKEPTAVYLPMMQGSKAEQRKWWLYNRFRYMDSKWNAGDALSDVIQIRGYAKSNVTVTPYADIYPSVKYGSYLVQTRGQHGVATTLVCPIDTLNDTEIYIYSASQLASVGDLSGFKVGFADFSKATKLQALKIGDGDSQYDNPNLTDLTLGNNVLLKTVDVRNCSSLVNPVDMSGCRNVESVYFDGTAVTAVTLPVGGVLKTLHLPATITNLTIRQQPGLIDLTVGGYTNISTLWLDNIGSTIDTEAILRAIPANSRVRVIGFYWEAQDATEIDGLFDLLDTMRGLDEYGNNVETAQVSGTIHTSALTGAEIAEFNQRYPYVTVTADHTSAQLKYYNYDGTQLLNTETVLDGGNGTYSGQPTRAQTAQYTYTFAGWSTQMNATSAEANATKNVTADRSVYAAYTATVRTYTVYFYNGSTLLQTVNNVPYGGSATYTGTTPVDPSGQSLAFKGWSPQPTNIVGNTSCYAQFQSPVEVAEITDSWGTIIANIDNGTYATEYKVGNYKPLDLGTEGTINMQIVAIDKDELADGSGYAPLTFIGMELLATSHRMNPVRVANTEGTGTLGGWEKCEMRAYLKNTIKPLIPSNVMGRINRVTKYTQIYQASNETAVNNVATTEDVWIPSNYELTGNLETVGVSYKTFFHNESSKIKAKTSGTAIVWWVRSANLNVNFYDVYSDGSISSTKAQNSHGIALGFCLGREQETITDDWATIIANTQNGTYSTKYSIGDTKSLDLGTEGKVLMELVGIDADTKADGNGTAPTTWIAKQLLATSHRMNPELSPSASPYNEGTGAIGGWEKSEMRTYLKETIKPLIPQTVRDAITPVTKYTKSAQSGGNSVNNMATTEDVWIPSTYEVGSGNHESTGVNYDSVFTSKSSRRKKKIGATSASNWYSRTSFSSASFSYITSDGSFTGALGAYFMFGVALGFCI